MNNVVCCRDAVISGGYLYVLAVTLGDMPKEGLSGSGTFTNQQDLSANMPFDIYLAKINLSEFPCCDSARSNVIQQYRIDLHRQASASRFHPRGSILYSLALRLCFNA